MNRRPKPSWPINKYVGPLPGNYSRGKLYSKRDRRCSKCNRRLVSREPRGDRILCAICDSGWL